MNIRNRMADVVKLRCNICQDLLSLIIKPSWRQIIFEIAKDQIDNKKAYKDKYISAYDKMRDKGLENYSIADMDVSFILQVIFYCQESISTISPETKNALRIVGADRNYMGHPSENEAVEELYQEGISALYNLEKLIKTFDRNETDIDYTARTEFRDKYITLIKSLKGTLDDERIEFVQREKEMDKDISNLLNSKKPLNTWVKIKERYGFNHPVNNDTLLKFCEFAVKASEAGVKEAYEDATIYYFSIKKYDKVEEMLSLIYKISNGKNVNDMHFIIDQICHYQKLGKELTDSMSKLLFDIESQGYPLYQSKEGYFYWKSR